MLEMEERDIRIPFHKSLGIDAKVALVSINFEIKFICTKHEVERLKNNEKGGNDMIYVLLKL